MSTNKPNTNHTTKHLRRATALLLTAGTLAGGVIATPASACGGGNCAQAPTAAAK